LILDYEGQLAVLLKFRICVVISATLRSCVHRKL